MFDNVAIKRKKPKNISWCEVVNEAVQCFKIKMLNLNDFLQPFSSFSLGFCFYMNFGASWDFLNITKTSWKFSKQLLMA